MFGIMSTRHAHIILALAELLLISCERERIVDPGPDTTAPLPPAGVVVEGARDGYIFVGWLPGRERDLRGYIVYRSEGISPGSFAPVDTLTLNFIIDEQRSYDTTYFYFVTAIDESGNESVPSDTVSAISENRYAPDAPRQLSVNGYNDGVRRELRLSWEPVDESDLAHYRIYRDRAPISEADSMLLLTETVLTFFDDSAGMQMDTRYFYAVTAVDNGGWESALSPMESDVVAQRPVPVSPVNGAKTVVFPLLRWTAVPAAASYLVTVALSEEAGEIWSGYVSAGSRDTLAFRYGGSALTPGERYYWRVSSVTAQNGKPNGVSDVQQFVADD
jgi:fibronectin type 3 domain-containing protein